MINCGAIPLHLSETKQIQLQNHRMTIIKRENNDEKHATLNATNYTKSTENETVNETGWNKQVSGLKPQYWVIIGVGTCILLITSLAIIRMSTNHFGSTGTTVNVETKQYNNPPPTAPESTAAHKGTSPIKCKLKVEQEDGPPSYSLAQIQNMSTEQKQQLQRSLRKKYQA